MDPRKRGNVSELDLTNIVNGPRAKRARPTYAEDDDVEMTDATTSDSLVMKQGMRLWNAVKNYKDLTGRELSMDFMKLVPKKFYPDYYKIIQRPMAMDNVRSRLELNGYPSLEAVRDDINLIFENAKAYNMEGSGIYGDAADLQAVISREYANITGSVVKESETQGALDKLLKGTTNELCQATDEIGFVLTTHFMDLPDGNLYPAYYHVIKKPMCFNHIMRKIARHEYTSTTSWGQDVELIFQNAHTFNEDGSPIVAQAKALQLLYQNLIDKFPEGYAVEKPAAKSTVIKLKVGRPKKTTDDNPAGASPVKQRVSETPAAQSDKATPDPVVKREEAIIPATPPRGDSRPPATPAITIPQTAAKPQPPQTPISQPIIQFQQTPRPNPVATPSPVVRAPPFPSHTRPYGYPPSASQPQFPPGPPFQSSFVLGPATPLPEGMMKNPITTVALRTLPMGRVIWLDAREGVSSWSIRLSGKREQSLSIDRVEIEDEDDSNDEGVKEEPEVPKPRRRGRPPTRSLAAQQNMMNGNGHVKKVVALEYLRGLVVKLNGRQLYPVEDTGTDLVSRQWHVDLAAGASVVDIGAWRVYVDRD